MEFFFNPQGIAVVGATPNPLKGGNALLKNILFGYRGRIYPINPKYPEIEGLNCYPSVSAIPDPVDLAVVWIIGRRDDAYAFQKQALSYGIPVFTELSRAAECLAVVLGGGRRRHIVLE